MNKRMWGVIALAAAIVVAGASPVTAETYDQTTTRTVPYATWLDKSEAMDKKIMGALRGVKRAAGRNSMSGVRNNLRILYNRNAQVVAWHKGKQAEACYQQDWTRNLKFAKAQARSWKRVSRLANRGQLTAALRTMKQAGKQRGRWISWYNDSPYRWECK